MKHGRVTCSLFTSTFYELYILVLLTADVIRLRQGKMLINFFKTDVHLYIDLISTGKQWTYFTTVRIDLRSNESPVVMHDV